MSMELDPRTIELGLDTMELELLGLGTWDYGIENWKKGL